MAKVESGSVKVELTHAEFEAVQTALRIADRYDYNELWSSILADLEKGGK